MMAFILATDFDFIAYMSKMAFFLKAFFTPMAFLEYDVLILWRQWHAVNDVHNYICIGWHDICRSGST